MNIYTKKPRKAYKWSMLEEKLELVLAVLGNVSNRKELAKEKEITLNSINIWVRNYQIYEEDGLTCNKRTA